MGDMKLEEFMDKAAPIMMGKLKTAGINKECQSLAISFLRIKYDRGRAFRQLRKGL